MDLKKVASYLREAAGEIKQLKEENLQLREKIAKIEKNASFAQENEFIGFGDISESDGLEYPNNPIDELRAYFQ